MAEADYTPGHAMADLQNAMYGRQVMTTPGIEAELRAIVTRLYRAGQANERRAAGSLPDGVEATTFTVSLLPYDHIDAPLFALAVEKRSEGTWAVMRMRHCLGVGGEWDFEPSPSNREDEWLATHRFDLDTALTLAREAAPAVRVNGRTAADAASRTYCDEG
jgi:hypothetical protein